MENKILEIFIPGPAGRLEAKYFKSKKNTSPIALVLQPHPQYGGTMNNKIVVETFHTFMENDFSVCRVNFRGVGKSDGEFDNGQGELADAAAALDWLERENFDNSQCWVSGFSFGSLIAMQLLMRRPEINRFIAISPQPNVYDFSFLSPCPTSGLMVYGKKDELVPNEYLIDLNKKLSEQKGIKVEFQSITDANHFFSKNEVDEIWITFPDPQKKIQRKKHRLTNPDFLKMYKKILKKGGIINLKTDSEFLHGYTLGLIEAMGIAPIFSNHDIYSNNNAPTEALEIQTFYEKKFLDSKKITFLQFKFD